MDSTKNKELERGKSNGTEIEHLAAGSRQPAKDEILYAERPDRTLEQMAERIRSLEMANEQLQQVIAGHQRAEAATRAKSRFLAHMSHELRTPLNGILGFVQILKEGKNLNARQKHGLSVIQRSGQYLLALINDILDLSKIEASKMELVLSRFHLPSLLQSVVEIVRLHAEQRGLLLCYEPYDFVQDRPVGHLPATIKGDEKRLRQVLINLLSNAIKFTRKGHVFLRVGTAGSGIPGKDGDRQRIRFQVEDTGIGIAPSHLELIFMPFHQVPASRPSVEGTGLGLAISRELVQLMGSTLRVQSVPEQGSVFWFDLEVPVEEWEMQGRNDGERTQPVTLPVQLPGERVARLQHVALRGDIEGILKEANAVEALDVAFAPFTAELRRLAQNFEVEKIIQLVEQLER